MLDTGAFPKGATVCNDLRHKRVLQGAEQLPGNQRQGPNRKAADQDQCERDENARHLKTGPQQISQKECAAATQCDAIDMQRPNNSWHSMFNRFGGQSRPVEYRLVVGRCSRAAAGRHGDGQAVGENAVGRPTVRETPCSHANCTSQWSATPRRRAHYRDHLDRSLLKRPQDTFALTVRAWRRAEAAVAGWPRIAVSISDRRKCWVHGWDRFPELLWRDVQAWLGRLAGHDFLEDAPFRPVRPATLGHRKWQLRSFATAVVLGG